MFSGWKAPLSYPERRDDLKVDVMNESNSDLFRNFAIGFVAAALVLVLQSGPELWNVIPEAVAATLR